jgi:hypothetical protein
MVGQMSDGKVETSSGKLADIELFNGSYWFTAVSSATQGTIQGPFTTKREAEQAREQYTLQGSGQLCLSDTSSSA